MNNFCVVFYGPGASSNNIVVYPSFGTWELANNWIQQQQNQGYYYVASAFTPPAYPPTSPPSPTAITQGFFVALFGSVNLSGKLEFIVYGGFGSMVDAKGYIAGTQNQWMYQAKQVAALPA